MNMDVGRESEMNLSRQELRVLLLHEFRLGRKTKEAASHILYDKRGRALDSYSTTLVQSL